MYLHASHVQQHRQRATWSCASMCKLSFYPTFLSQSRHTCSSCNQLYALAGVACTTTQAKSNLVLCQHVQAQLLPYFSIPTVGSERFPRRFDHPGTHAAVATNLMHSHASLVQQHRQRATWSCASMCKLSFYPTFLSPQ